MPEDKLFLTVPDAQAARKVKEAVRRVMDGELNDRFHRANTRYVPDDMFLGKTTVAHDNGQTEAVKIYSGPTASDKSDVQQDSEDFTIDAYNRFGDLPEDAWVYIAIIDGQWEVIPSGGGSGDGGGGGTIPGLDECAACCWDSGGATWTVRPSDGDQTLCDRLNDAAVTGDVEGEIRIVCPDCTACSETCEFDAADYGTPIAWYHGESIGASDGSPVDTWQDSSGSGVDLSQPNAFHQPVLSVGTTSGGCTYQAIAFDGNSDMLRNADARLYDGEQFHSGFAVVKFDTVGVNGNIWRSVTGEAFTNARVELRSNGTLHIGLRDQSGTFHSGNSSNTFSADTLYVISWVVDTTADTMKAWVNGTIWVNTTPTMSSIADGDEPGGIGSNDKSLQLGAWEEDNTDIPTTRYLDGEIANLALYKEAISDADRESAEDCLGGQYGVTITH